MNSNSDHAEALLERAGDQARHAAKNTGRAAKAVAEPVVEAVAEEAEDVVRNLRSELTMGIFALSISLGTGALAFIKLHKAASGRADS